MAPNKKKCINTIADEIDFKCPICLEIPSEGIFQCNKGHIVCHSCNNSISTCPLCRESRRIYGSSRNTFLEKVLDRIKFRCEYNDYGCNQKFIRQELRKHEESCKYKKKAEKLAKKLKTKAKAQAKAKAKAKTKAPKKQGPKPRERDAGNEGPRPQMRKLRSKSVPR